MATKALLYSADKLSFEKTKESRCKALVRQLLAIEIGKRVYQYVVTHAHPHSTLKPSNPAFYQHHIEPKLYRVNRREMEELERFAAQSMTNF